MKKIPCSLDKKRRHGYTKKQLNRKKNADGKKDGGLGFAESRQLV